MVKPLTRVLVAEDEADIRELLVDILVDAGYEVIGVDDGRKALDTARSLHPDIVLLDVMLPAMDGFEVLASLKAEVDTASVPVIMVTAKAQKQDQAEAMKRGAMGYVTKPWVAGEIEAKVAAAEQMIRREGNFGNGNHR